MTEIQQREIIRVLWHCIGLVSSSSTRSSSLETNLVAVSQAKAYNPYYTLIVQRLCSNSHSHKVTLQYCLWDFLRELGEKNVGGTEVVKNAEFGGKGKKVSESKLSNLARALAWWVAKDATNLLILKVSSYHSTGLQISTLKYTTIAHRFHANPTPDSITPSDVPHTTIHQLSSNIPIDDFLENSTEICGFFRT